MPPEEIVQCARNPPGRCQNVRHRRILPRDFTKKAPWQLYVRQGFRKVEDTGLEPVTFWLPAKRSPN